MMFSAEFAPSSRNLTIAAKRGFTLAEVLTVIAIVAIVAAILFSVLIAAKERAKVAVDISNLRQMGVAGSIYAADWDDAYPLSVRPLVRLDPKLKDVCASPSDNTQEGLTRKFIDGLSLARERIPQDGFRCSYIGPADGLWTWDSFQRQLGSARGLGWLVNLARAEHRRGRVHASLGIYQRLLLDGSVQTRRMGFQSLWIEGTLETKVIKFAAYFCDEDAEWLERQ